MLSFVSLFSVGMKLLGNEQLPRISFPGSDGIFVSTSWTPVVFAKDTSAQAFGDMAMLKSGWVQFSASFVTQRYLLTRTIDREFEANLT